jgi:hypothetical protein
MNPQSQLLYLRHKITRFISIAPLSISVYDPSNFCSLQPENPQNQNHNRHWSRNSPENVELGSHNELSFMGVKLHKRTDDCLGKLASELVDGFKMTDGNCRCW